MPGQAVFTPGPIFHFVQFRNNSNAFFLGTAVTAPKQGIKKFEIPVMNDLSGRSTRFQSVQDGYEGDVVTTLNRFDLKLIQSIMALGNGLPAAGPAGPTPLSVLGSETGFARGTLTIGVSDFSLILVNGYAGTAAVGQPLASAVDLSTARGWSSCSNMRYEENTEGTRALEVTLVVECRNVYNPTTRGFSLYLEGTPTNLQPVT